MSLISEIIQYFSHLSTTMNSKVWTWWFLLLSPTLVHQHCIITDWVVMNNSSWLLFMLILVGLSFSYFCACDWCCCISLSLLQGALASSRIDHVHQPLRRFFEPPWKLKVHKMCGSSDPFWNPRRRCKVPLQSARGGELIIISIGCNSMLSPEILPPIS